MTAGVVSLVVVGSVSTGTPTAKVRSSPETNPVVSVPGAGKKLSTVRSAEMPVMTGSPAAPGNVMLAVSEKVMPAGAVKVTVSPSAGATLENVPLNATGRLRTGISSDLPSAVTVKDVPTNVLAVTRNRVWPSIGAPLVGRKLVSFTTVIPGPVETSKVTACGLPCASIAWTSTGSVCPSAMKSDDGDATMVSVPPRKLSVGSLEHDHVTADTSTTEPRSQRFIWEPSLRKTVMMPQDQKRCRGAISSRRIDNRSTPRN